MESLVDEKEKEKKSKCEFWKNVQPPPS
jgi:hypothetical protein